ncbi:hypothetical protein EJB05_31900, partial [Eragrostis curvula]
MPLLRIPPLPGCTRRLLRSSSPVTPTRTGWSPHISNFNQHYGLFIAIESDFFRIPEVAVRIYVLVADVGGRHHVCHRFSCGVLSSVSHPFRRQGDSLRCGPYELVCTDTNSTIRIGGGTYYVVSINNHATPPYFWVVDTNLGMQGSCPLPRWDYHAYGHKSLEFSDSQWDYHFARPWATFVNCSQKINDSSYNLVSYLSTTNSFIYVLTGYNTFSARNFKPSCGYLAMTPLDYSDISVPDDASYEDVVKSMSYKDVEKSMRKGFFIPFSLLEMSYSVRARECLAHTIRFRNRRFQFFSLLKLEAPDGPNRAHGPRDSIRSSSPGGGRRRSYQSTPRLTPQSPLRSSALRPRTDR